MSLLHLYKTSSKDILENQGHAVSSNDMPLLRGCKLNCVKACS